MLSQLRLPEEDMDVSEPAVESAWNCLRNLATLGAMLARQYSLGGILGGVI